jgi:uncharacterized membrane protein YbhN (UPF0104 family)
MLKLLSIFCLSNININILKNLNINLHQRESAELTVRNTLGNLTTPFKLGTGYKVSFLKNKYDLKLTDFIYWNTFFSILNLVPLTLLFLTISVWNSAFFLKGNYIYFLIGLFLICIITFLIYNLNFIKNRIYRYKLISSNNFKIQISNLVYFFSSSTIIYILASNFTLSIEYYSALSYSFLNSFINLLNLTPGNIGIKETVLILLDDIHSMSFQVIIIISFIERMVTFFALLFSQIILKFKKLLL